LCCFSVSSLFGKKGELVSQPKRLNQIVFSALLYSLKGSIPVKVEKVVVEMLIETVDLIVNKAINSE